MTADGQAALAVRLGDVTRLGMRLVPFGATLLAILLGLIQIGQRSIWLDESASIFVATADPSRFLDLVTHSKLNMSLYFVLLRPWTVFGTGEGVVRLFGLLLAAGAIPFVYLAVRRLIDEGAAALSALTVAVNAFFIEWARQARGYGLSMLLVSAATYVLVRMIDDTRRRWWIAYGLLSGLALYAHVFAGLVTVGHGVTLLIAYRNGPMLRRWGAGLAVMVLVSAPMLLAIGAGRASALDWIGDLSLNTIRVTLRNLSGGGWAFFAYLAGLALSAVVLGRWVRRGDQRWRGLVLLMCWALVPFVLSVAVSVVKPVLVPRYLLISLPAFVAVVVVGFYHAIPERRLGLALALATFAITSVSLPAYYAATDRYDFRGLTATVSRETKAGDAIIWQREFQARPSVYYAARLGLTSLPQPLLTRIAWTGNPYVVAAPRVRPDACHPPRIWLVGAIAPTASDASGRLGDIARLLSEYQGVGPGRQFGKLRLRLYERVAAGPLPTCATPATG